MANQLSYHVKLLSKNLFFVEIQSKTAIDQIWSFQVATSKWGAKWSHCIIFDVASYQRYWRRMSFPSCKFRSPWLMVNGQLGGLITPLRCKVYASMQCLVQALKIIGINPILVGGGGKNYPPYRIYWKLEKFSACSNFSNFSIRGWGGGNFTPPPNQNRVKPGEGV